MEVGFDAFQQHAVLRALRAGQRRLDVAEVEREHVGVVGLGVASSCHMPCAFA
jgi:hypothetical protein